MRANCLVCLFAVVTLWASETPTPALSNNADNESPFLTVIFCHCSLGGIGAEAMAFASSVVIGAAVSMLMGSGNVLRTAMASSVGISNRMMLTNMRAAVASKMWARGNSAKKREWVFVRFINLLTAVSMEVPLT